MKAIYIKPEMEIVQLNTGELLQDQEWGNLGKYSQKDRWTGNGGFFEEEQNNNGNGEFFKD